MLAGITGILLLSVARTVDAVASAGITSSAFTYWDRASVQSNMQDADKPLITLSAEDL
ncbi:hypothetical protein ABG811_10430 [Streptococcus iniae]